MKVHTNLSIENDLLEKAKARQMNLSQVLEKALNNIICGKVDAKQEEKFCKSCGKSATETELTFLCPEEIWICNHCLKGEINKVPIVIGTRRG